MMAIRSSLRLMQTSMRQPLIFRDVRFIQQVFNRSVHDIKLYSEDHEWIQVDGDTGKIGISEYAKEKLGDIVYVQLPEVDAVVQSSDECGAIESVKAASDVYTPVSGVIVEVNQSVEDNCDVINKSPEEDGWLFKIRLSDKEELKKLMDKSAYEAFIKDEES